MDFRVGFKYIEVNDGGQLLRIDEGVQREFAVETGRGRGEELELEACVGSDDEALNVGVDEEGKNFVVGPLCCVLLHHFLCDITEIRLADLKGVFEHRFLVGFASLFGVKPCLREDSNKDIGLDLLSDDNLGE